MTHSEADVSSVACCLKIPGNDDDSVAAEYRVKVQMPRIVAVRSLRTCGREPPTKFCHGRNFGQAQTDDVPLLVKSVNMADIPDKAMAPIGTAD
ncbi:hypothetical protein HYQ46_004269 [Verticillium longisporum]|nr:hypothetical protein HYQ46_004269 [Verticillium longisporum]